MAVGVQSSAGQPVTSAFVTAKRVDAPVLAQSVTIAQQTFVDVFKRGRILNSIFFFINAHNPNRLC